MTCWSVKRYITDTFWGHFYGTLHRTRSWFLEEHRNKLKVTRFNSTCTVSVHHMWDKTLTFSLASVLFLIRPPTHNSVSSCTCSCSDRSNKQQSQLLDSFIIFYIYVAVFINRPFERMKERLISLIIFIVCVKISCHFYVTDCFSLVWWFYVHVRIWQFVS